MSKISWYNSIRALFHFAPGLPYRKVFLVLIIFPWTKDKRTTRSWLNGSCYGRIIPRRYSALPYLMFLMVWGLCTGCNLEKEIQIDLPNFDNGYVVESYLSPDNDFGLLITKSYGFFEVFDSNLLDPDHLSDILVQGVNGYIE